MRTLKSIIVIVAALALILGLSVASVSREQARLVEDFTAATHQQARASAAVLSARLDALDQDTRVLVDLVERSGRSGEPDPATERRVWEGAFRALAVVVAQYRTIALVDADGNLEILAADPTETADTVEALGPHTRRLGMEVAAKRTKTLGQTARYGARSFLLYGTPVEGGRAVVVASDAAIFLAAVAWAHRSDARLFVTDPAGVVWAGCEMAGGCQATAANAINDDIESDVTPVRQLPTRGGRVVRSTRVSALRISERVERPTGSWVITWLVSTQAIVERQWSAVSRVVLAAVAAALAVAAVGAAILRQQRKAAELEGRLLYAQALANARETSQAIVDNAPLGVLGVSRDGRVALANNFLVQRLGPIRIGAPLGEAFPAAAADWIREVTPLLLGEPRPGEGAADSEGASAANARRDVRAVVTDAHQFHVRIVPVRNHELGVQTFALMEDRSELRDLEHQLVRAEKLITVGVLSAGIAHEIGSPLAVIRGRAEQVLRAQGEGPRAEDLRVIIKHIDSITSTIRRILDFSRRQPIERQPVALDAIVERAVSLLQWKVEAKQVTLGLALEDALPPLAADPDQLQQVLVNLLLNACDASSAGGRVTVTARSGGEGVVAIEVADRGCGIAPEHMNAVFDPFFTTKKRGEGTGLGLPIAASIVRNHGGEINLDSKPGQGTTVTITWPTTREPRRATVHA